MDPEFQIQIDLNFLAENWSTVLLWSWLATSLIQYPFWAKKLTKILYDEKPTDPYGSMIFGTICGTLLAAIPLSYVFIPVWGWWINPEKK